MASSMKIESIDFFISQCRRSRLKPMEARTLSSGECATTRSVVVASGGRYRRLDCEGGNSVGQAPLYLAGKAAKVRLLIHRRNLESTMSRYLIDRITGKPNVNGNGAQVKRSAPRRSHQP